MKCFRGCMMAFALVGTATLANAQDWPQWRGPNRDNKLTGFNVPKEWPKALAQKWKVTVGIGESFPAIVGDRFYVFGRQGGDEVTTCLDAMTGKEVWTDKNPAAAVGGHAKEYQGPRSTIAVAGSLILWTLD